MPSLKKSKIQNPKPPVGAKRQGATCPDNSGRHGKIQIVFIGAGNMAEAMVRGILKAGLYRPADILVADIDARRLKYFRRELGVMGTADNKQTASAAGVIVLAVKPQQAAAVLNELRGNLTENILLISIVTGFTTGKIIVSLGQPARIIRVVPNTPALVGSGASAYCCGKGTTTKDEWVVENILKSIGIAVRLDEPLMDAATALSGSGPAYVFYLVEALLKAGQEIGLTEENARRLIEATVAGAAHMLSETGARPDELRQRVTSRGGTTAAALEIMNKDGMQATIIAAVKAAHKRAMELSAQ